MNYNFAIALFMALIMAPNQICAAIPEAKSSMDSLHNQKTENTDQTDKIHSVDSIESFKEYKKQIDDNIQNNLRRNLQKQIFLPETQGNFLNNDININETHDHIIYRIDIPSMHQKEVKVFIRNNSIVLYNKIPLPELKETSLSRYVQKQRYGVFQRVIPLPQNISKQSISPTEKNGVLIITVDKI